MVDRVIKGMRVHQVDLHDFDEVELLCCGDTHFGSAEHNGRMSDWVIDWVGDERNRFVVFAGDLFNAALPGTASKEAVFKDSSPSDAYAAGVSWLKRVDAGIGDGAHHIIASVQGNHDHRFDVATGIDAAAHAFFEAGAHYGGLMDCVSLAVGTNAASHRTPGYTLFLHHGVGGGRKMGGKANAMAELADLVPNADIVVQGHTHGTLCTPVSQMLFSQNHRSIVSVERLLVTVPGMVTYEGYPKAKAYRPTSDFLMPVIRLSGTRHLMEFDYRHV